MPIRYRIDHGLKLVVAAGYGDFASEEVFRYQRDVWSRPEVAGYNELVDMSHVTHIELPSPDNIKKLARLAAEMDLPGASSKFAIVAPANLSFGLGRMFQTHRELDPRSTKQVAVFKTMDEALEFLQIAGPLELPPPEAPGT
jgi:hypothetical protein